MMNHAWNILQHYAQHNPNINDFQTFTELTNRLEQHQPFQIARYNDGEWVFILKIEPYYTMYIRDNKHHPDEVADISQKLLSVLESRPPYYIGVDSNTQAGKGPIILAMGRFKQLISPLNIVYGEIFNTATVKFGISALTKPLQGRWVITVGPEYMNRLGMGTIHITVPKYNCWAASPQIEQQLHNIIASNLHKKPVIVYACSLLAKWLVDVCYQQYGDQITQLDVGSCIDPWCGVISRPWHGDVIRQTGKRLPEGPQVSILPTSVSTGLPAPGVYASRKEASKPIIAVIENQASKPPSINAPVPTTEPGLPVLPVSISTGRPAPRSGFK